MSTPYGAYKDFPRRSCVEPVGQKQSRCQLILSQLQQDEIEIARLGRLASRSAKAHARYAPDLERAKAIRASHRAERDEHVSVCEFAQARWSA